jgi:hypothetical protein
MPIGRKIGRKFALPFFPQGRETGDVGVMQKNIPERFNNAGNFGSLAGPRICHRV